MWTTVVYDGQKNLCALALSTRLRSPLQRGRIISLSKFWLAPNADPTRLSPSVFPVAIARYWLAFQFKSSLPFSWFLLNHKLRESLASKPKIRTTSKGRYLNHYTMRADEHGRHMPTSLFFDRASRRANSVITKTINQKTSVHMQNSLNPHSTGCLS